ncbi:lytic murein transglycosylase B [Undibacterium amnicola]|uniref:Lytic murein transglycosylase B n=1 Tax=Undibacterium amnicola TaxID=1834038 RepID=A0ABR6XNG9_9BURK|nr:lytic murein transglycosylase B [Undibacterium amnicola]MBC3830926.1 lytic murein transglycosylase B [Undibacterium amnicola]
MKLLPRILSAVVSSAFLINAGAASAFLFSDHAYAAISNKKKTQTTQKPSANKPQDVHYLEWQEVQTFIAQMQTQHQFSAVQLQQIFENARHMESAVQLVKPAPPGKPKNWKAYRARFVENGRIAAGVAFWERNQDALKRAENVYGVPADIIVGLIGVETIYGKNTGSFRAIDALTTLAFSYPETPTREARTNFFKNELAQLLLHVRESGSDIYSIKSSYAGAIGLAQFMPSSLRQFAVDFDADNKIDLKESEADAIGSVANYLAKHGWKKDQPYAFAATLLDQDPASIPLKEALNQGLKTSYSIDDLKSVVSTADDKAPRHLKYGLIDLQNGEDPTEYWFATDNFFAITKYNRSYFYAMSVIDLGNVIALARQKEQ